MRINVENATLEFDASDQRMADLPKWLPMSHLEEVFESTAGLFFAVRHHRDNLRDELAHEDLNTEQAFKIDSLTARAAHLHKLTMYLGDVFAPQMVDEFLKSIPGIKHS